MRNRLEMVLEWSDFTFLLIGSHDEKDSENRNCSKLIKNHPTNQFWHEKSIENGFRMIRLLFLAQRFPWWKRVRKSKMFQIDQKSSYKPILTWGIDWIWFQNVQTRATPGTPASIKYLVSLNVSSHQDLWTEI